MGHRFLHSRFREGNRGLARQRVVLFAFASTASVFLSLPKRRIHIGPLDKHEEVSPEFEFASDF